MKVMQAHKPSPVKAVAELLVYVAGLVVLLYVLLVWAPS